MAEITRVTNELGSSSPVSPAGSLAARYRQLENARRPFLEKARRVSELTIPALLPPEGIAADQLRQPFQSIGANGVNNLASKLLLTLLPPNQPFYKEELDELEVSKLRREDEGESLLADLQSALSMIEQAVLKEAEIMGLRVDLYEALRHGIVAGNALLKLPLSTAEEDERARVFHLDSFVVSRDPGGRLLELIVKESVAVSTLPAELQPLAAAVGAPTTNHGRPGSPAPESPVVELYTGAKWNGQKFDVWQEFGGGVVVPDSNGVFTSRDLPFIPLRFIKIAGEDYGNSYAGEYEGDLHSLEVLSEALVEGASAAARVLFLVNPNGSTKIRDLATARNGDFKAGNAEDVTILQLDKLHDFAIAQNEKQSIVTRLNAAFLLNSSVQRQAERVTAQEINFMARELETALGGIFTLLSADLQLPLVWKLKRRLKARKRLPELPTDIVRPKVVAGFEALGRSADLERLDQFLSGVIQLFGPEALRHINLSDYLTRRAAALGLNTSGLIKTPEQLQAEAQTAQMQAIVEQLGPNAVNKIGDFINNQQQQASSNNVSNQS